MRRLLPALALFLLAPLVAEFLLGDFPITYLAALVLLAPMYGGGALLIREVVRRTGRGWPSIVLLALAYGVVEEGLVTQSLFDPDYAGAHLLDRGFVPGLGIALPWTLFVLGLHTVWSISVPVALVEELAGERRTQPWLRRTGLAVTAALLVAGAAVTTLFTYAQYHYMAPAPRLAAAAAVAVALAVLAFRLPVAGPPVARLSAGRAPYSRLAAGRVPSARVAAGRAPYSRLAAGRVPSARPAPGPLPVFLASLAAGACSWSRWPHPRRSRSPCRWRSTRRRPGR
ncbi:hypothetical protein GCM10009530_27300 [Microbispora corallina]|uniref:CPBP family intramembrane metalloprotease n=1 Tax=Microbispora corallina TaxID=83302 RepID=A0ABQ4FZ84_9ACTN|nr:hypothetical protein [Microbispora corallina]GIH40115.1 hypothetical protein Mco01_31150 [Microbispora corallina]